MLSTKWFLHIFIVTLVLMAAVCDARGGRRGGSMGGLFGSWRKYKKPSSGVAGSSRRIVSSSPVHTPITKALNDKKAAEKFGKNGKPFNSKYTTPPLPTGGSYYTNTATLPAKSVYIAQAPPRGAEFGDFLTGYLTGRLLTLGMTPHYSPHQYITHVYPENHNQSAADNTNSTKVIIIDNNQQQSVLPSSSVSTPTALRQTASPWDSTTEIEQSSTSLSSTHTSFTTAANTTPGADTTPPPYGIICIPLMVNEANASGNVVPVERTVCYPAPAPATAIQSEIKSKPVEIAGDIVEH